MTITAPGSAEPAQLSDRELQARITGPDARCVASAGDPDEWFPVTSQPTKARAQSSHALALCAACAVRADCLELALRCWGTPASTASGAERLNPSAGECASSGFPASASPNCWDGGPDNGYDN